MKKNKNIPSNVIDFSTFIEDYKRRLDTVNEMLIKIEVVETEDEKETFTRLKTKASEYRTFIAELERINEKKELNVYNIIDKLLGERESIKESLNRVNRLISEGLDYLNDFPDRWYVRQPDQNVVDYINQKYNKELKVDGLLGFECGFGELHGEFAFVPHDVDYSWEITQEEFDQIILNIKL